jgi:hypothetical protein|tara:strand:+ start:2002 stop:2295 length:294 start_codon:yes stop_codon:yes gene_type:complete
MKKKKVILLGFPSPIRMRNKGYVIEKLYSRARTNPFIYGKTYQQYREFLCNQIKDFSDKDIDHNDEGLIYDNLKSMGWIKIVSAVLIAVVSDHIAIS